MTRFDLTHLGEHAVYPGHPAVIAYLILLEYNGRLDEAFAKGRESPGALENGSIPGAGGNVYGGLDVIQRIQDGMSPESSLALADEEWMSCDGQGNSIILSPHDGSDVTERYRARWRDGQAQADRIMPNMLEMLEKVR